MKTKCKTGSQGSISKKTWQVCSHEKQRTKLAMRHPIEIQQHKYAKKK